MQEKISFKNTNMHSLNYFTIGNHEIEIFKNKFQNISKFSKNSSVKLTVLSARGKISSVRC